jgi:hypothetical protein
MQEPIARNTHKPASDPAPMRRKAEGAGSSQAKRPVNTRPHMAGPQQRLPGQRPGMYDKNRTAEHLPTGGSQPRLHANYHPGHSSTHSQGARRPYPQTKETLHQHTNGRQTSPHAQEAPEVRQAMVHAANRHNKIIFTTLLGFLVILGLLFPLWPKQTMSKDENRALAQKPAWNWSEVFSGEYSSAMDSYYADQFPFRQQLLSINRGISAVRNYFPQKSEEQIHLITAKKDSGGKGGVENPEEVLSSQVEETVAETEVKETELQPKEVKATEAKLHTQDQLDFETSNIVIIGNRAMEIHYYSPEYTADYAKHINHLASILPEDTRLISMVVPTAVAFYGTEDLRTGNYSNFEAIQNIYNHEDSSIFKVDAYSELAKHVDEYIYFRTDHHWTGLGAYYAYVAFCNALELEAAPLEQLERHDAEGYFLGTLYGYTDKSPLLLSGEDQGMFYLPQHEASYNYYSDAKMDDPIPGALLAYSAPTDNHYMLYLGGDVALGHIESENKNGKSILVLKDSFGNAFIPYLIDQYQDIYVVDPRRFTDPLLDFIKAHEIDDVMVINYTFAVSNPDWLGGFELITDYPQDEPETEASEG